MNKWDSIITQHPTNKKIDIIIDISDLDVGVLGSAMITSTELIDGNSNNDVWNNYASLSGTLTINSTYIDGMKQELSMMKSTLYYLVLHEVGHILGIGPIWYMGTSTAIYEMISDQGTNNPFYTGENAVREYRRYFGDTYDLSGALIPIENDGGAGTEHVHPEEGHEEGVSTNDRIIDGVFYPGLDKELMTGWTDTAPDPLPL